MPRGSGGEGAAKVRKAVHCPCSGAARAKAISAATILLGWPAAGAPVSQMWIDGVTHMQTAIVGGPSVLMWLHQRLDGVPNVPNCSIPPPVAPVKG